MKRRFKKQETADQVAKMLQKFKGKEITLHVRESQKTRRMPSILKKTPHDSEKEFSRKIFIDIVGCFENSPKTWVIYLTENISHKSFREILLREIQKIKK